MAARRRNLLEDGERLGDEIFGTASGVSRPPPPPPLPRIRHPDAESPFPSDYFFAIGVSEHGVCLVVLTARRYWESSHAQSDWHLTPLIGHLLPRGFDEVQESTFETSFGTDGTYASLLQQGFLAGPPEFQEYFGCTLPENPHPDARLRDGGLRPPPPPPPSPPPTRRSRVDWDDDRGRNIDPFWTPQPSRRNRSAPALNDPKKTGYKNKKESKPEPPRPTAWQHILGDDPYEDD